MGILSSVGHFLKNPIQPITHAVGNAVGVTANTKNGIHVDPVKLALTAGSLALPGVGTGIAGALSHIPGVGGALASGVTSLGAGERALLGKIPGAAAVGNAVFGHGGAPPAAADVGSSGGWEDPTGGVIDTPYGSPAGTSSSGGLLNTILGNAKAEAGRVVKRVASGQSPIAGLGGGGGAGGAGGAGGSSSGGGISPLLLELLAGAQGVSAANAYSKMGDLQDKALNTAETSYADRAPLRTAGIAGMTAAPVKLNLPSTGNPFAQRAA